MSATSGLCYIVSELLYHALGGKGTGWTPINMQHEGVSHWALRHEDGTIMDATVGQFETPPDYSKAAGRMFLTPRPCARTQVLINRANR